MLRALKLASGSLASLLGHVTSRSGFSLSRNMHRATRGHVTASWVGQSAATVLLHEGYRTNVLTYTRTLQEHLQSVSVVHARSLW